MGIIKRKLSFSAQTDNGPPCWLYGLSEEMSPREQDCGRKASVLGSVKKRHCLELFRVAAAANKSRFPQRERNANRAEKRNSGMVGPAGIEPATLGLEIRCSIRLSYGPSRAANRAILSCSHSHSRGLRNYGLNFGTQSPTAFFESA
jgi:hypothetical protein